MVKTRINYPKEVKLLNNIIKYPKTPIRRLGLDIYDVESYTYKKMKKFERVGYVTIKKEGRSLYPTITKSGIDYLRFIKKLIRKRKNGNYKFTKKI